MRDPMKDAMDKYRVYLAAAALAVRELDPMTKHIIKDGSSYSARSELEAQEERAIMKIR